MADARSMSFRIANTGKPDFVELVCRYTYKLMMTAKADIILFTQDTYNDRYSWPPLSPRAAPSGTQESILVRLVPALLPQLKTVRECLLKGDSPLIPARCAEFQSSDSFK